MAEQLETPLGRAAAKILLVDDDEDYSFIVRKLLGQPGNPEHEIAWVSTFEDGLAEASSGGHDVVLLDFRLGARDGLEFLDELTARGGDIPVIMLTGEGRREIDVLAMERGASDYLAKDRLDSASLERCIRYSIERHGLVRALRQRAVETERRATELQRLTESLEQFVWIASHDLQTPLRTITYSLQSLTRRMEGESDAQAGGLLERSLAAGERMSQLVRSLRVYAQSLSEEMEQAPTDCDKIVADIVSDLGGLAESADITIEGKLPVVTSSRHHLSQVFENLIQNAIKHSGEGRARVHIAAARCEEGWEFSITDDGPGLGHTRPERIFLPFQHSENSAQAPGGGVGLAVCKRLVERQGGRIWFKPGPERGAAFHFTVPDGEGVYRPNGQVAG